MNRMQKLGGVALLSVLPLTGYANPIGLEDGGPAGEITGSWQVGPVPCGGCGPTVTAEFFIVGDTGAGPFESPGLSTLPGGWTASLMNPNYVFATGPSVNPLSGWTEHYFGNILASVEIDLFFWSGAPLASTISFAANYTRAVNGGLTVHCQNFGAGCATQNDPTGVNYDRSAVSAAVPEPATLALLGLGLAGLGFSRRKSLKS